MVGIGIFGIVAGISLAVFVLLAIAYRTVVEPNEVHIVQSNSGKTIYGLDNDTEINNSYYSWPSWVPVIGVQVKVLPLSVFSLELNGYEAYDVGKVPFVVDVVSFFRIDDPSLAAQRITSLRELNEQLHSILQGAARTILAKHEIEDIMMDRSTYGDLFTQETADQLSAWGVTNVKNIELMDIRDGNGSKVVSDIQAKKESLIDKESRTEVATNKQAARIAEIAAEQEVQVREQEALELIGRRTADKDKAVGIATEQAQQEIKLEARTTMARDMEIKRVAEVQQAEINKSVRVVAAEQLRETQVIEAEGKKQETVTLAEGSLAEQQKQAEGILAIGQSQAESRRLAEMALVDPQIALATEIGDNEGYQTYLTSIRSIEKDQAVGIEQAKALQEAQIKVIANTGSVTNGVNNAMDLFSSKGGTAIGAAVEGFAQTPQGAKVLENLGIHSDKENRTNGAA